MQSQPFTTANTLACHGSNVLQSIATILSTTPTVNADHLASRTTILNSTISTGIATKREYAPTTSDPSKLLHSQVHAYLIRIFRMKKKLKNITVVQDIYCG